MERTHISGCLLSKQRLALAPKAKGKITHHTKPHKAVHTAPDRLWHIPYRNAYLPRLSEHQDAKLGPPAQACGKEQNAQATRYGSAVSHQSNGTRMTF